MEKDNNKPKNKENDTPIKTNPKEDNDNQLSTVDSNNSNDNFEINVIATKRKKKKKNFYNVINNNKSNGNNENLDFDTSINESNIKNQSQLQILNNIDIKKEMTSKKINNNNSISSSSTVFHVPNTSFNDLVKENKKISNSNNKEIQNNHSTLTESIKTSIYRDLNLIYTKLKFVINPFSNNEKKVLHIIQWDLWGPLIFDICLSCCLSVNSDNKSNIITLLFTIFWIGGFFIYLNAHFLGVKCSLFQILCLLGYCLFPMNIDGIVLMFLRFGKIFRFVVSLFFCFWSIYSANSLMKIIIINNKRHLVMFPCVLLYFYIAWFIFAVGN